VTTPLLLGGGYTSDIRVKFFFEVFWKSNCHLMVANTPHLGANILKLSVTLGNPFEKRTV